MSDINTALELLAQIIQEQEKIDKAANIKAVKENRCLDAIGGSWTSFHLKQLQEILIEERNWINDTLQPHNFHKNDLLNK